MTDTRAWMVMMASLVTTVHPRRPNVSSLRRSNCAHASQVRPDTAALAARRDHPDHQDHPAQQAKTAKVATTVFVAMVAKEAATESPVQRAHPELMVTQDLKWRDHLDLRANPEMTAHPASQATRARPARQVPMARQATPEMPEQLAVTARRAPMESRAQRAHLAHRVRAHTAHHHERRQDTKLKRFSERPPVRIASWNSFAEARLEAAPRFARLWFSFFVLIMRK